MLINLRNALMARKRLDVQDYARWGESAMLSMFDGIRNRGATSEHDGSITTSWTDIVRNVNATGSFGEMTDAGPKAMSSATNFPKLEFTIPISRSATSWTMELCFSTIVNTSDTYWVILASKETSSSRFQINIEGNMRFHFITPSVGTVNSGITDNAEKKGTLALTWNGSSIKLYWNGDYRAQSSMTSTQWNNTLRSSDTTFFGRQASFGYVEHFWGTIHNCRMYSAALTADEIAANYSIDKARFGLP